MKTFKLPLEQYSVTIKDISPADAHINCKHIVYKPTLILNLIVGTNGVSNEPFITKQINKTYWRK